MHVAAELAALADWQLVHERVHEALRNIVGTDGTIDFEIVEVAQCICDFPSLPLTRIVNGLGPLIGAEEVQAGARSPMEASNERIEAGTGARSLAGNIDPQKLWMRSKQAMAWNCSPSQ